MKNVFEFLLGFSLICLFVLFSWILSIILENIPITQIWLYCGEFSIVAWGYYFGHKLLTMYNEKQLKEQENIEQINQENLELEPVMICENKKTKK